MYLAPILLALGLPPAKLPSLPAPCATASAVRSQPGRYASAIAGPAESIARSRHAGRRFPSPDGRHLAVVDGTAVLVDGRPVQRGRSAGDVLAAPIWRADGRALAWLELDRQALRLVVLPDLGRDTEPLRWSLPRPVGGERVYWAGDSRVIVGTALLAPRAVATWE